MRPVKIKAKLGSGGSRLYSKVFKEAGIRKIAIQSQPGQIVHKTLS
jgi:hypothetical protein